MAVRLQEAVEYERYSCDMLGRRYFELFEAVRHGVVHVQHGRHLRRRRPRRARLILVVDVRVHRRSAKNVASSR